MARKSRRRNRAAVARAKGGRARPREKRSELKAEVESCRALVMDPGDIVRELRRKHGLSRLDLSRLTGLSEGTIYRAEMTGKVSERAAWELAWTFGQNGTAREREALRSKLSPPPQSKSNDLLESALAEPAAAS